MLPSPSTRHSTNGLSSYIGMSVDSLYCVADTVSRNVRSELCCSSPALPSVFLPLSSSPTPFCVLENKNPLGHRIQRLTRQLRTIRPNVHLAFQFVIPLLQVLVPLDGRLKEIYDGGMEEGVRLMIKSRLSFQTQTSPDCRWHRSFLGRKKNHGRTSPLVTSAGFDGGGRALPDLKLLTIILRLGCVHVHAQSAYHAAGQ